MTLPAPNCPQIVFCPLCCVELDRRSMWFADQVCCCRFCADLFHPAELVRRFAFLRSLGWDAGLSTTMGLVYWVPLGPVAIDRMPSWVQHLPEGVRHHVITNDELSHPTWQVDPATVKPIPEPDPNRPCVPGAPSRFGPTAN